MPKGKGKKGKKGKGKKRTQKLPAPPPLHDLTEIYKKLENGLRSLFDMRVIARKKRLEGWFMTKEMKDSKNDSNLYHDYLEDNISELKLQIEKFLKLLQEEREALVKAIENVTRDLQKRLMECLAQEAKVSRELDITRTKLLEYEPFMEQLTRLMARVEDLLRQINAASFHRDRKVRHLTNQYLTSRAHLHNHLQQQLNNLVQQCRRFIMPLLWNFLQGVLKGNRCIRWELERTDDRNIILGEKRDELMQKRQLLALQKPYWNVEWMFFKLAEIDARRHKEKLQEQENRIVAQRSLAAKKLVSKRVLSSETTQAGASRTTKGKATRLPFQLPSMTTVQALEGGPRRQKSQLGKDFNKFLLQRLTATREAKNRAEQEKKKAEEDFLEHVLEEAKSYRPSMWWLMMEEQGEQEDWLDEQWEDNYEPNYEEE